MEIFFLGILTIIAIIYVCTDYIDQGMVNENSDDITFMLTPLMGGGYSLSYLDINLMRYGLFVNNNGENIWLNLNDHTAMTESNVVIFKDKQQAIPEMKARLEYIKDKRNLYHYGDYEVIKVNEKELL